jgi:aquaglyceroporin related protein
LNDDSEDTQVPPEYSQQSHENRDPERIRTTIDGRRVNMRRVPTEEANRMHSSHGPEHEGRERAPVNEHGLTYNNDTGTPGRNHFGLADGLPPLKEIDSHKTTQSEKEKNEIDQREHDAQQDYVRNILKHQQSF